MWRTEGPHRSHWDAEQEGAGGAAGEGPKKVFEQIGPPKTTPPPPFARATGGAVSAPFGIMEFGGFIFWWSLKITVFRGFEARGWYFRDADRCPATHCHPLRVLWRWRLGPDAKCIHDAVVTACVFLRCAQTTPLSKQQEVLFPSNHLEERLLDQAQACASYNPLFGGHLRSIPQGMILDVQPLGKSLFCLTKRSPNGFLDSEASIT